MLANSGSTEQMQRCGIKKIKDELKLKRLIVGVKSNTMKAPTVQAGSSTVDRKLKVAELQLLSPEDKQTYLIKYVHVIAALFKTIFFFFSEETG